MATVSIRDLKADTREVLRRVSEQGETIAVSLHGRPVAHIRPAHDTGTSREDQELFWAEIDQLAKEISAKWPKGVSAVEAIRDVRREL